MGSTVSGAGEARCPKCGGVFDDAAVCTYCSKGVRYGGRGYTASRTRLPCPRCSESALYEIPLENLSVDVCIDCGGAWFDLGELESLVNRARQDLREGTFTPAAASASGPAQSPVGQGYIKCPQCETVMNRKNWERRSGVVVDWCPSHGIWLDGGEVEQLRSWAARTPDGPPAPPQEAPPKDYSVAEPGWMQTDRTGARGLILPTSDNSPVVRRVLDILERLFG